MNIVYETRKDLPCKELHDLFYAVVLMMETLF